MFRTNNCSSSGGWYNDEQLFVQNMSRIN